MKKKFLCLILIMFMLPMFGLLSACGDKGYNLDNLDDEFYAIAESKTNVVVQDETLVFDYSNFSGLNNIVQKVKPYSEIINYNVIYENTMSFVFSYIDDCANNKAADNNDEKLEIQSKLSDFESAIAKVDENVTLLGQSIGLASDEEYIKTSSTCLYRLEKLLNSYEDLYLAAGNLSNVLSNFYFKHVSTGSNENPFDVVRGDYLSNRTEFKAEKYIKNINAKCKVQVSNLSQAFAAKFIGEKIGGEIVNVENNGGSSLDLNQDGYLSNVNDVNKTINETAAQVNVSDKTKLFYSALVELYNVESIVNEEFSNFRYAVEHFNYNEADQTKLSSQEKLCLDIIEGYADIVIDFSGKLLKVLELLQ